MPYLNYVKQNTTSVLCFSTHVKQNKIMMSVLNHVTHKTINVFCFIQSKHSALSAMCYLNQVMQCKSSTMVFLTILNTTD